jgi:translation initiation factor IF-2
VQKPQTKVVKKEEKIKQIILPEVLTIKELADKMKIVPSVIIKKLFLQGKVVTVNQEVDYDTAEEIAMEFDVLCEKEVVIDVIEELLKEDDEDTSKMTKRPPVVCVMGHVDHGKTSLLDAIRDANVIDREAGGITQHIGAYTVQINGEDITFLDTPGHEAFTSMRMRGASSTDIAILVVAADDGVMPQTIEAISHAKAAGVEIIVAINKVDKPSANIERVKQELTEYELISEDWGGSTVFVPVSAKTRDGITELLEMIILTSEVMELKANPERSARGLVIEGLLDKGKGAVATVLVQKGTLRVGDSIAAGSAFGKVRAMMDHKGKRVKVAGPSMPVEILGLNGVPNAGEVFVGCENEKDARSFGETFISQNRVKMLDETKSKMSLDDLFTQIHEGNLKELNIIVKADVQGSVEALKQSLLKLSNEEVVIKIIHGGVGAINESDVILASTSNAIIIGFNVRPDGTAKETADHEGVDMRLYKVIYNAIEDVEAAMKGMLDPIFEEKVIGHAEIRQIFKASGIGNIAGSYVLDGTFERGCKVRITRDGDIIFDGALASLKRFKDDVKEVRAGYECGLVFDSFNDVKEEDKVEAYKMVEVERK